MILFVVGIRHSSGWLRGRVFSFKHTNFIFIYRCNFIRLVTVLYKCGLESLRELFLRIHPSWKNEPGDIKRIVNGKFRPDSYEQSKFNSGDINEWDITLICKVLLYSKASKQRLEKDKEFRGYEDAIKSIRDIKNTMLSHNRSNSISKTEYEKAINTLQGSVIKLGFSRQIFEDTLEGAFSCFFIFF